MKDRVKLAIGWVLLILLDQLVKLWVLKDLKDHPPIPLIKNVLEFTYVENRGAAFGILQNKIWFFVIVSVIVLGVIWYLAGKIPQSKRFFWLRLCMYFIGAGAVGNMIDRVFRHYVVDFIYFKLIDFPVFNVADIYVTCAAFLLAFLVIFYYKDEELEQIFPDKKKTEKVTDR